MTRTTAVGRSLRETGLVLSILFTIQVLILAPSSQLKAQWQLLTTLSAPADCGFFFDESSGFVGTGIREAPNHRAMIFKTVNGGKTWRQMATPSGYGAVTSIHMLNAMNGLASVYSDQYQIMWSTSDGGNTWVDASPTPYGEGTCVFATPAATTLTQWHSIGGSISSSTGTYQEIFYGGRQDYSNGIDFADQTHGVVSMGPMATYGYYTADGGVTWNVGNGLPESWSVYALKGTRTFFSAAEETGFSAQIIYASTDGGMSWKVRYTFNDPNVHFTGHIAGAGSTLYAQSSTQSRTSSKGMFRSDDLGLTWKSVGGPSHSRDTRFVVTGCNGNVVFAFDTLGNIYKTVNGGDGTMPPGTLTPMAFGAVPPVKAGEHTLIPLYLRAPSAKFSISSFAFHLNFNGDVLTPDTLAVTGTLSEKASFKNAALSGNTGVSGIVTLSNPITEKTDLTIPLVKVSVRATLSDSMSTRILIDSFAINGLTSLSVCSVPETEFTLLPQCGDSTISYTMGNRPLLDLLGVSPNPSHGGELHVAFNIGASLPVSIEVLDAFGTIHYRDSRSFATGQNQFLVNTSGLMSGTYFLLIQTPGQAPIIAKLSQLR